MDDLSIFWPFWAGLAWIVTVVGISVAYRLRRGKPIFPGRPVGTTFLARRASGRSLDTPWGRLGGASNCLQVAVMPDVLLVTPTFPFNLMFLPEIYGLEHRIPLRAITGVEQHRGLLGSSVLVSFGTDKPHRIELRVKKPEALTAALAVRRRG